MPLPSNNTCGECRKDYAEFDEAVPCSGVCNQNFHLACAGVNRTVYANLMKTSQLRFYCKPCSQLNIVAVIQRIDAMTASMKSLVTQFGELASLMTSTLSTSVASSLESIPRAGGATYSQVVGNLTSTSLQSVPVAKKSLYVGRLQTSTTVDDIVSYTAEKLGIAATNIDARALIPKDKNVSQLTFISFKLTVPTERFDELLVSSCWPIGVIVHPFISKDRPSRAYQPAMLPGPSTSHSKND